MSNDSEHTKNLDLKGFELPFTATPRHEAFAARLAIAFWQITLPKQFQEWAMQYQTASEGKKETLMENAAMTLEALQVIGRIPSKKALYVVVHNFIQQGITFENSPKPMEYVQEYKRVWEEENPPRRLG